MIHHEGHKGHEGDAVGREAIVSAKPSKFESCYLRIVIDFLQNNWMIEHHFILPSGNEIDIIAQSKATTQQILVIECKPRLSRQKFYAAIGQVLAYLAEFGKNALPAIASYSSEVTDDIVDTCKKLESS